jgi:hypothetical protein
MPAARRANPPNAPQPIAQPKLLLGEGFDELRFFTALLLHLGIGDVQVQQFGGKNNLGAYLKLLAQVPTPGFQSVVSVGLTRDADADPATAFQSVCTALQNAGLSVPAGPNVATAGLPVVRTFILPDNSSPGLLEDLCLASVRANPAFACLESYFHCVQSAGRQQTEPSKAQVHAWLASEVAPDKRLGEAAEAGYWPWNDPAFMPLIDFVKSI